MSTSNDLILYTSPETQPETGLYHYGARYLDPKTSRWLSGDLLDLV
jgi:RHS repeat-associated protein